MKRFCMLLVVALGLSACGRAQRLVGNVVEVTKAPIETKIVDTTPRTLAYEHTVQLTMPEDRIAAAYASVQTICSELGRRSCEMLDSRVDSGRWPSASLKLRAEPAAIGKIQASLGAMGTITQQSTSVEDLAVPIADTQKKLALKQNYRARLEALVPKAAADVDSLIKINKELAEVQSEIEDAAGQSAFLAKRVNTELLSISIHSPEAIGVWQPLANTPEAFVRNLAEGTSATISTMAFLTPWAVLLAALVMAIRFVRRRRRKQAAT